MAKILVNYPSRSRPAKFFKIMQSYHEKSSGLHEIEYFIKVDSDDFTMNNDRVVSFLNKLGVKFDLQVLTERKGKVAAINYGVAKKDFDFVICVADDIDVLDKNWDDIAVQEFAGNYDLCLNYNCDPRYKDFANEIIVLPIIGKKLFDKFGYIYNPIYLSENCDDEQFQIFRKMNKIKTLDKKLYHHDWWGNQDPLMEKNKQEGLLDRKTYRKRLAENFGYSANDPRLI